MSSATASRVACVRPARWTRAPCAGERPGHRAADGTGAAVDHRVLVRQQHVSSLRFGPRVKLLDPGGALSMPTALTGVNAASTFGASRSIGIPLESGDQMVSGMATSGSRQHMSGARPAGTTKKAPPAGLHAVLGLQRAAGNRAVQQLLAQRRSGSFSAPSPAAGSSTQTAPPPESLLPTSVQRCGGEVHAGCECATTAGSKSADGSDTDNDPTAVQLTRADTTAVQAAASDTEESTTEGQPAGARAVVRRC